MANKKENYSNNKWLNPAIVLGVVMGLFATTVSVVSSQDELTIATRRVVADENAVVGDIVSFNQNRQLLRSSQSFDPLIYGVISETAVIIYHPKEEGLPITTQGDVLVNVTTLTGPIEVGSIITSSPIAGKGQKAENPNGWVLGRALEAFNEDQGQQQLTYEDRQVRAGQIRVSLTIGPGENVSAGVFSNLVDQLGLLIFKNIETPSRTENFFRYLIAALVAIAAIGIGFGSFGRNITHGIEAIGRNPLAKNQIQAMIILNIFLIALISVAGIVLSLAIIRQ